MRFLRAVHSVLHIALLGPLASAHGIGGNEGWDLKNFTTLVSFGDSYSDTGRFAYFVAHNGSAPPPGYVPPPGNAFGNTSYAWPLYVSWYTGAHLYNYAVNGAGCSNKISPRYLNLLHGEYPDVEGYEIPAYVADTQYTQPDGTNFFVGTPQDTVYSMWIGTNDLNIGAMLTDSQPPGVNLTTYTDCVFAQLERIYDAGARYFVLQNLLPSQLTPLLATPENGGVGPNHYWPLKPSNLTAISFKMMEMVVATNQVLEYRLPFEVALVRRFPGARFALMDVYGLILDIWENPREYLNGTAPANNTGFISHCTLDQSVCTQLPSPDSFLWYDESHPSEQADRVLARTFVDVVGGSSKWATYWSG